MVPRDDTPRDTYAEALRPSKVGESLMPGGKLNKRGTLAHTLVDVTAIVSLTVLAALGKIEGYVAVCAVCLIAGVWLAQGGGKAGGTPPHLGVLLGSLQGLWELVRRFRGVAVLPLMLLTACGAVAPQLDALRLRLDNLRHVQAAVCDQAEATLADVAAVLPSSAGVTVDIEPATLEVIGPQPVTVSGARDEPPETEPVSGVPPEPEPAEPEPEEPSP